MDNNVTLTDDELSVIQTVLEMSIKAYHIFVQTNGENMIDNETREIIKQMKQLHEKLLKEYF